MEAAIRIGEYLIPHAQAAFAMMGVAAGPEASVVADAWHVSAWLRRQARSTFTSRDAHQGNRSRFSKASDVTPVLNLLAAKNVIRTVGMPPGGGRGRPAAQRYEVNPAFLAANSRFSEGI